ncbi:MAG: hypothetical protein RL015_862 [Verrucomicrobiota bacterium]|jgi:hypothetical protein
MRLTHFALALTILLLCITGYLAWEGQEAARGAREELAFVKKQQTAQANAAPSTNQQVQLPTVPAASISPPAPGSIAPQAPAAELPTAGASTLPGGGMTIPKTIVEAEAKGINTNTLTPIQKQVQDAKPVGKIKAVVKEQGFVVLDVGSNQGLKKGQPFDIRRGNAVLAKVIVTDTIEPNEAVADLDLASIPAGVTLEPGDEIIPPVGR